MAKKMTATQRENRAIQMAAAKVICGNTVTKYGVGYRIADIVKAVRDIVGHITITPKKFLDAIQSWIDGKMVTFNNKYMIPTQKGMPKIAKLVPA